jgi:CCCH zinc finger in TRM13 protein
MANCCSSDYSLLSDCFRRTLSAKQSCSVEANKISRMTDTCAYWLSKRNRYCLTKPVTGEAYCQVHLERAGIDHLPANDSCQTGDTSQPCHQTCSDESVERPVPTPGRCHFWLAKKRRYCKLLVSAEAEFCVEHSIALEVDMLCTIIPEVAGFLALLDSGVWCIKTVDYGSL